MTIKDASYFAIETALNGYLSLDPEISSQFAKLHGNSIGFELLGLGMTLFFIPNQTGQIQVLSQYEDEPDCLVRGSPISLLRSSGNNSADQIFSGNVQIEGNSALAQEFTRILLQVDVDWEELLSQLTGDIIAHQIGSQFRNARFWLKRNTDSTELNIQEYLQEEIRLVPGFYELDNFFTEVDLLRDQSERLSARLQRLQKSKSLNTDGGSQ